MFIIPKLAVFICLAITQGYGQGALDCEKDPFNDGCLQRRAAKRSVGFVGITHCRKQEDFDGSILLIDVKTTNSTESLSTVENVTQHDERHNACLMKRLRPKVTGYPAVSNAQIDYRVCYVDDTLGYIVLEYTCIKAESNHIGTKRKIQLPQCSGGITGSRIRIDTTDFPDSGWNNTGNDCNCTISTLSRFLNVTTYVMRLTKRQRVSIANDDGVAYMRTNLTQNVVMVTDRLPVNGTLWLTWNNTERVVVNSSKFWMEIEADGANISVNCFHPRINEPTESPIFTTELNSRESVPTDVTKQPNTGQSASQRQSSSPYSTTDVMDFTTDWVPTNSSTAAEKNCCCWTWAGFGFAFGFLVGLGFVCCVLFCRAGREPKETTTKVSVQNSSVGQSVSGRPNSPSQSQPDQHVTKATSETSRGSKKETTTEGSVQYSSVGKRVDVRPNSPCASQPGQHVTKATSETSRGSKKEPENKRRNELGPMA